MFTRIWNAISVDSTRAIIQQTMYMSLANKKVPSLMKDENNGAIMTIGLRAKMYAMRVDGKKDIKKLKGIKNIVARTITFDYTRCLNEDIEMTCHQSCIRSKLHEVYTISESKIALSHTMTNDTSYRTRRRALADTFVIYVTIMYYLL